MSCAQSATRPTCASNAGSAGWRNASPTGACTPAWLCPRDADGSWTAPSGTPDLCLHIVQGTADSLTAEVVSGMCPSRNPLLFVMERGLFVIVATLVVGSQLYLRLRSWSPALEWSA